MVARKKTTQKAPVNKGNYQDELRQGITQKIIDALAAGQTPWRRPWVGDENAGYPMNIVSKKRYSGINPLLLEITALDRGYSSKWWATYDQWASLGGQVQKRPADVKSGDWGTHIVFYNVVEKEQQNKDGSVGVRKIFFLKNYTVFNIDQVDGDKIDKYRVNKNAPIVPNVINWEPAEQLVTATGAQIEYGGDRACYMRPSPAYPNHTAGDYIRMPKKEQFVTDPSEFYVTQFHELSHWSECRLGWEGSYEMGELIAEISACYLAAETKVPNISLENHNKYLATWLKKMQDDPKWIFQASTQASKVSDFLLNFGAEASEEHPASQAA